jgi:FMN phosphatase YigB (HAD superfamily)
LIWFFGSGDEGLLKPDPAAYDLTLKRLGVLPHEAVFIDDNGGHVEASQKMGIHGIIFTNAVELAQKLNHLFGVSGNFILD